MTCAHMSSSLEELVTVLKIHLPEPHCSILLSQNFQERSLVILSKTNIQGDYCY